MRPEARAALTHWQEFLPKKYQQLKETGQLEREAEKTAAQYYDRLIELQDQGLNYLEAVEMAEKELIYLMPEPEVQARLNSDLEA